MQELYALYSVETQPGARFVIAMPRSIIGDEIVKHVNINPIPPGTVKVGRYMHRTAYIIDTTWYRFSELDTKPLDQVIDPHRIGMDIMFARLPVDFTPDPTNPAYDLFMDTPEIIWRIIKKETK